MNVAELQALVQASFQGDLVEVSEEGGHFTVRVVSEKMAELSAVKRQQAVYAPLAECIASGEVHAVNIEALTPSEHSA